MFWRSRNYQLGFIKYIINFICWENIINTICYIFLSIATKCLIVWRKNDQNCQNKLRELIFFFSCLQVTLSFTLMNGWCGLSRSVVSCYLHRSIFLIKILISAKLRLKEIHWDFPIPSPAKIFATLSTQSQKSLFSGNFKNFSLTLF